MGFFPRPRTVALTSALTAAIAATVLALGCSSEPFTDSKSAGSGSSDPGVVETKAVNEPTLFAGSRPNIILLSIDTLRADHLGSYGYERPTSPYLDAFAEQSIRYAEARAPSPWTLPSHIGMLTGVHPYALRVDNQYRKIPDETPVLAELLATAGYRTAAFVDSKEQGLLGASRHFDRGFETYAHGPHEPNATTLEDHAMRFDMAKTVDAALAWLNGLSSEDPFFLFLHTKSVHAVPVDDPCRDSRCLPYDKPEPFRFRFIEDLEAPWAWSLADRKAQEYLWAVNTRILDGKVRPERFERARLEALVAFYDAGIAYTDFHFGRMIQELENADRLDDTVIIVTADHGEAFLDHRLFLHHEVYEPLLHVPLLVRLPGPQRKSAVIEQPVELTDLVPSLARWLGLPAPEPLTGRPLPLSEPPTSPIGPERDFFAYYLFPTKVDYSAFAVRRGDWKLVLQSRRAAELPQAELYHLGRDPGELQPIDDPQRIEDMERAVRRFLHAPPIAKAPEVPRPAPNDRKDDLLHSLGYIE